MPSRVAKRTPTALVTPRRPPPTSGRLIRPASRASGSKPNSRWMFSSTSSPLETASAVPTNQLRSEEHTSELQSRLHLVCRLLLEKKKKTDSQYVLFYITTTHQTNQRK